MATSTRTRNTLIALAISGGLIALGYFLPNLLLTKVVEAESTRELLEAYAKKDVDGDGLMDWQEALYGTNPENAHSVDPLLTDLQAVNEGRIKPKFSSETAATEEIDLDTIPGVTPGEGTVTDRFAREFFSNYIGSRGTNPPTAEELISFVENEVAGLEVDDGAAAYTTRDIRVEGTGTAAIETYNVAVHDAARAASPRYETNEVAYLSDALSKNDVEALDKVRTIGQAYETLAEMLIDIPVPNELAAKHLNVVNALAYMGRAIEHMSELSADPLQGLLGIREYEAAALNMRNTFRDMDQTLRGFGVIPADSRPQ